MKQILCTVVILFFAVVANAVEQNFNAVFGIDGDVKFSAKITGLNNDGNFEIQYTLTVPHNGTYTTSEKTCPEKFSLEESNNVLTRDCYGYHFYPQWTVTDQIEHVDNNEIQKKILKFGLSVHRVTSTPTGLGLSNNTHSQNPLYYYGASKDQQTEPKPVIWVGHKYGEKVYFDPVTAILP